MKNTVKALIPEIAKPLVRFIAYGYERKRFFREIAIRKEQNTRMRQSYNPNATKLIVFLIPGAELKTGKETISGGALSIISIAENTACLGSIHEAETIVCTINEDPLLIKYQNFENHTVIFRFSQLKTYFKHLEEIIVHVPEFMFHLFWNRLSSTEKKWLKARRRFHLNIMNQNIRYMPDRKEIASFVHQAHLVTITTAHQKYCSSFYRELYGVPIHKFSVWISPEQYERRPWAAKENLLVVSPDSHPEKESVLEILRSIKGLKVQEIQNLTYADYKALVASAKWSLTFGEGLDAYLIEPIFSGAIGIAIYNEDFFTPDFKPLDTIYTSLAKLKVNILHDLERLDGTYVGATYQQLQYALCAKYYSKETYLNNIASFYKSEYTYQ